MPWQVVHVGESVLPLAARPPWALSINCLVISGWHEPQVWGMFDRKIVDFGSIKDLKLWLPWPFVQVISPVFPCTLFLNSSLGIAAPKACCFTNSTSEWQRLQVLSMLETFVMDLGFLLGRILCLPWQY